MKLKEILMGGISFVEKVAKPYIVFRILIRNKIDKLN